MPQNNAEKLILDAAKKEVREEFTERDALFIGMQEYQKPGLLLALESRDPTLMTLLVTPSVERIGGKPEEEELLSLYVGESNSKTKKGSIKSPIEPIEYTIDSLLNEVKFLGPNEKLYIDGKEYSRDNLLLALEKKEPFLMQHLVIPASRKAFGEEEYRKLLLGHSKESSDRSISNPNSLINPNLSSKEKRCLLVNPKFDRASNFSYLWSIELAQVLESMGLEIITIGGRKVRRKEVERAIVEKNPPLVIFYDHGQASRLLGSRTETVVDFKNVDLLADREIYTTACLSAKELGKEAMRKGCNMYWGSTKPIMLTTTSNWVYRRHMNNGIIKKITSPKMSWDDAFDDTQRLGENLYKFLLGENKPLEAFSISNDNDGLAAYVKEKKVIEKLGGSVPLCFGMFGSRE